MMERNEIIDALRQAARDWALEDVTLLRQAANLIEQDGPKVHNAQHDKTRADQATEAAEALSRQYADAERRAKETRRKLNEAKAVIIDQAHVITNLRTNYRTLSDRTPMTATEINARRR